jgi:MFS family permease
VDSQAAKSNRVRTAFSAFTVSAFRWVWFGALSGNSARYAVILVAGWEAYRLGNQSGLWPSLVSFFLLVPTMLFGLIAGSYADRVNRANLAMLGQSINALSCILAALGIFTNTIGLAGVLASAAIVGIGNSIQGPAWQSLIPELVGPSRMVNAALATRIAQQGSELVGPALGTLVLTTVGPGPTYLLCAAMYLTGLGMLSRVRQSSPKGYLVVNQKQSLVEQIAKGFSYIKSTPPLGLLFLWVTCHCSLTMAIFGILPTIASENFHGKAGVYGLLLTSFGLGSVIGPLGMMVVSKEPRHGLGLWVSGVLSGLPLIVLGLTHLEVLALVMSALAGMAQAIFMSLIYSSVMLCTFSSMRGRISSIQLSITTGAMGMASLGWGALVSIACASLVLAVPGAAFVIICLGLIYNIRDLNDQITQRGEAVYGTDTEMTLG